MAPRGEFDGTERAVRDAQGPGPSRRAQAAPFGRPGSALIGWLLMRLRLADGPGRSLILKTKKRAPTKGDVHVSIFLGGLDWP